METLVVVYAVAAAAVGAYAARLVVGTGRLSRRLLQLQTQTISKHENPLSKKVA